MKTAIYIEDGILQVVLTPETEFEKAALKLPGPVEAKVITGSFYDCRGGWVRQTAHHEASYYGSGSREDQSLIIRIAAKPAEEEPRQEERSSVFPLDEIGS